MRWNRGFRGGFTFEEEERGDVLRGRWEGKGLRGGHKGPGRDEAGEEEEQKRRLTVKLLQEEAMHPIPKEEGGREGGRVCLDSRAFRLGSAEEDPVSWALASFSCSRRFSSSSWACLCISPWIKLPDYARTGFFSPGRPEHHSGRFESLAGPCPLL